MNVRTCGRYLGLGAGVLALVLVAGAGSKAMAGEQGSAYAGLDQAAAPVRDGDTVAALEADQIPLAQR